MLNIENVISEWRKLSKAGKRDAISQLQQLLDAEDIEKELEDESDYPVELEEKKYPHFVIQGDIYKHETVEFVEKIVEKVDLIFTSPPYRIGINYDCFDDNMPYDEYVDFLKRACFNCDYLLKPGGRFVINIRDIKLDNGYRFPAIILFHGILSDELGYDYRGQHIWYKGREESSTGWGSWMQSKNPSIVDLYEWVLVFEKPGGYPPGPDNMGKTEFVESVLGVWKIRPVKKITGKGKVNISGHPCPFPVELPRRIIKLYSHVGDMVLDPFGGIASTSVAALHTGRGSVSVDISENYCDEGYRRLKNEIGIDIFDKKTVKIKRLTV